MKSKDRYLGPSWGQTIGLYWLGTGDWISEQYAMDVLQSHGFNYEEAAAYLAGLRDDYRRLLDEVRGNYFPPNCRARV